MQQAQAVKGGRVGKQGVYGAFRRGVNGKPGAGGYASVCAEVGGGVAAVPYSTRPVAIPVDSDGAGARR
jgi:hypothetical protein